MAAFCKFTVQAHEGNSHAPRGAAGVNEGKVQELVGRIKHFLDDRRGADYAAIRQMVAEVARLKVPEIKAIGDLNGDGKADVILRNKVSGQNIGWLMNGLTVANSAFLPTIADTNWQIVGPK